MDSFVIDKHRMNTITRCVVIQVWKPIYAKTLRQISKTNVYLFEVISELSAAFSRTAVIDPIDPQRCFTFKFSLILCQ